MIYKHSLNIQCSTGICIPNLSFLCLKMAEIKTFILLPWQPIYPINHTQKLLSNSTVTSILNLDLLNLQTAEIQKYPSVAMVTCSPQQWKYEGMNGSCLLNFLTVMQRISCDFVVLLELTIKIHLKFPAFTFNKPKGWSISASNTETNSVALIMKWWGWDHLNFAIPQGGSEKFYSYSRGITKIYEP